MDVGIWVETGRVLFNEAGANPRRIISSSSVSSN